LVIEDLDIGHLSTNVEKIETINFMSLPEYENTSTPKRLGYRMPAEWESHISTWLAWPHDHETWQDELLIQVEEIYLKMIQELHQAEEVHLLVDDQSEEDEVVEKLKRHDIVSNIFFHQIETVGPWIRDYGPTFLLNGEGKSAYCDWIFNAWGFKYDRQLADNEIPEILSDDLYMPRFRPRIVLEGGSIDVNGKGLLITTEQCLLNMNRNYGTEREELERILKEHLGIEQFIWLLGGLFGDDTDGHIDNVARFVNENTLVMIDEDDRTDVNCDMIRRNWRILEENRAGNMGMLNFIRLPMPRKIMAGEKRLPGSYANFYIGNEVVLVPVYGDSNDSRALGILRECFPKRRVVGVPSGALLVGGGAIHCVTQQQAAEPGT